MKFYKVLKRLTFEDFHKVGDGLDFGVHQVDIMIEDDVQVFFVKINIFLKANEVSADTP